jgi:CspA family cold shock protein
VTDVRGVVSEWHAEDGWGVVVANDGTSVWTHFSNIAADVESYRSLIDGEIVELEYETPGQDEYPARAVWVRPISQSNEQRP